MLIESCAAEAGLHLRSHYYQRNLPSTVAEVCVFSFIEDDEQQSILFELRTGKHGIDIGFEPIVGGDQLVVIETFGDLFGTIMRIVVLVRSDEAERGQLSGIQVRRKLIETYEIIALRRIVNRIGEVREWVVVVQIGTEISTGITNTGQTLLISLPGVA